MRFIRRALGTLCITFLVLEVVTLVLPATVRADAVRVAVWGDTDDRLADVVAKIKGTGLLTDVDAVNLCTQGVPTLGQALTYDSILVFGGNTSWGSAVSTTAGNVLADYADAGGGVVVGTFVLGANGGGGCSKAAGKPPRDTT